MVYSMVNSGLCITSKYSEAGEVAIDSLHQHPKNFDPENEIHVAALLGAKQLNRQLLNILRVVQLFEEATSFKNKFESQYGRCPIVRIRKDIFFDSKSGMGLSFREFRVLCAVYSVIGDKKYPVRITKSWIQHRMLGFKSRNTYDLYNNMNLQKVESFSIREIGHTMAKLRARGFFKSARANRRQTYYSHCLSQDKLEEEIFSMKMRSATLKSQRVNRDQHLMDRIKKAVNNVNTLPEQNNA